MKLDHIAIAVNDVEESAKHYSMVLGTDKIDYETISSEGVKIAIIHLENSCIELMEPISSDSPIQKFLDKKGPGLHHIALQVDDIDSQVSRMTECGIVFLGKVRSGSAGTRVTFIHPKSLDGVLAELCSL